MTAPQITALEAPVAALGESPVWSPRDGALYWVDIDGRRVHRHEPVSARHESRSLDGRPGSLALTAESSRLLVASEHQLLALDWATGTATRMLDLERAGTGNRLNDGRCDPAGRFLVGSMYEDTSAGLTTGMLHRVDLNGVSVTLRQSVGVSNGLAFDADRSRLYFADSPTRRILAFDYDLDSGALSNERVFFEYEDWPGKPDGACVDAEGCYWSASVHGWGLLRITPDGEMDRRVELPVQRPTMPCFGGGGLDILFVTSIGSSGSNPASSARDGFEPGAVLAIEGLGVRGLPEPRWAGPLP